MVDINTFVCVCISPDQLHQLLITVAFVVQISWCIYCIVHMEDIRVLYGYMSLYQWMSECMNMYVCIYTDCQWQWPAAFLSHCTQQATFAAVTTEGESYVLLAILQLKTTDYLRHMNFLRSPGRSRGSLTGFWMPPIFKMTFTSTSSTGLHRTYLLLVLVLPCTCGMLAVAKSPSSATSHITAT